MLKTIIVACGFAMLAACTPAPPAASIRVEDARIAEPPPGANVAAGYFVLHNQGGADELVAAETSAAGSTELHETQNNDGMMSMHHMAGVDLPANASVDFAPGGRHVMLIGLKTSLSAGASVPVTLSFAHAAPITVNFTVVAP